MRSGWKQVRLDELTVPDSPITYGVVKPGEPGDVLFIRGGDISHGQVLDHQLRTITKEVSEQYRRTLLRGGEILMCLVGQPGQVAVAPPALGGANIARQVGLIRLRSDINAEFVTYFLQSPDGQASLGTHTGGSVQQVINLGDLKTVIVPIPPLPEQQRIVRILDEAFEKIATAKANADKNLRNARDLFESHLEAVFSQRGEGWVETTLGEAYDVRDGTHDSPKYHATGYPLITSKNLKRGGLSFDDVKLISKQDYTKINERSAVHKGDVLFAMIGTIGNPTLVEVEPNFAIKNVALFKNPKGQSGSFLKHYLDSDLVISKMMMEAKGTTQKFVGLGYLRGFPIKLPPIPTQLKIVEELDELAKETQRLATIYERKLTALDELKKSLLHQAFNGEL